MPDPTEPHACGLMFFLVLLDSVAGAVEALVGAVFDRLGESILAGPAGLSLEVVGDGALVRLTLRLPERRWSRRYSMASAKASSKVQPTTPGMGVPMEALEEPMLPVLLLVFVFMVSTSFVSRMKTRLHCCFQHSR
ncbi:MAG: hypothetical protein IPL73_00290 [Candidatus Obscuribacter sp.]|nr:hypothetical protein [Candidatus Obscuribacter sp.]